MLLLLVSMTTVLTQETPAKNTSVESTTAITAVSDPDIEVIWNQTWGRPSEDYGRSLWSDGAYLYTFGSANNFADFALVKWDKQRNLIWNQTWGGAAYNELGYSISGDGTYLYTLGTTDSFGAGSYDFALFKLNATDGKQIWNQTWGGSGEDKGRSLWTDGTYIYTLGYTFSFGAGLNDFALVKWNAADGSQIWNQTWGGGSWDTGDSVWSDGVYVYTLGSAGYLGLSYFDFALLKWYPNGTLIWAELWGDGNERGFSLWGDETYLYTLGSSGYHTPTPDTEVVLAKWDKDGNVINHNVWDGPYSNDLDEGHSIWGDGTYLYTVGRTNVYQSGPVYLILQKWNLDLNLIWNLTWSSGPYSDTGLSILGDETHLYTLGHTENFGAGNSDFLLVKWGVAPPDIETTTITYEQNTTGHNIIWTATDASPDSYVVYKDDSQIQSGSWDGSPITTNIDGLAPALYNYTIVFFDEFGLSSTETVFVTVLSAGAPALNSPADISYGTADPPGHNITWIAEHNNPDNYVVYKNGSEHDSGIWNSANSIVVNVDGFSKGVYNLTIVVYGSLGNFAPDEVIVTVVAGQGGGGFIIEEGTGLIVVAIAVMAAIVILQEKLKQGTPT